MLGTSHMHGVLYMTTDKNCMWYQYHTACYDKSLYIVYANSVIFYPGLVVC